MGLCASTGWPCYRLRPVTAKRPYWRLYRPGIPSSLCSGFPWTRQIMIRPASYLRCLRPSNAWIRPAALPPNGSWPKHSIFQGSGVQGTRPTFRELWAYLSTIFLMRLACLIPLFWFWMTFTSLLSLASIWPWIIF